MDMGASHVTQVIRYIEDEFMNLLRLIGIYIVCLRVISTFCF